MSDNKIPKPLEVVAAAITSFITFITAIVGFVLLWQGNAKIVSTVVIAVGLLGLWGSFFYIRRARKPHKKETEADTGSGSKHRIRHRKPGFLYSGKLRKYASMGLYLLPIATVVAFGIHFLANQPPEPSDDVVILVAEFDGPDPQRYGVSQFMSEQLNEGLAGVRNVEIIMLKEAIRASEGVAEAHKAAEETQADLVVWGWYVAANSNIDVTYHIGAPSADLGLGITSSWDTPRNLKASGEYVNTFAFQSTTLADNVVFDTLRSIYILYHAQRNPQGALTTIDAARKYLEDHPASFSQYDYYYSSALSGRAGPLFELKGPTAGLNAANEALKYGPSSDAYYNRAAIYLSLGQQQAALDDLLESLKYPFLDPFAPYTTYDEIASIYYQRAEYDKAVEILTHGLANIKSCSAQYGCHILYYHRGATFVKLNDYARAEADFSLVKSMTGDPSIWKNMDGLLSTIK